MADLSDVTAYIATLVFPAVYPNGSSSPSIAPIPTATSTQTFTNPMDVRIYEGWPTSDQLDLDVGGKMEIPDVSTNPITTKVVPRPNGPCANVSIFPLVGTGNSVYQIQNHTYVITPATTNLTVTTSGTPGASNCSVTITGTPATGEFVTVEADRQFSYSSSGADAASILSALLADAQVNYPLASLTGNTLTIPAGYQFLVRQGGVGLLGKVTHRQCQYVMVTVWAPDHNSRSVISAAVDVALKNNIIITIPVDGSDAKITASRTTVIDTKQDVTVYRRDLVYEVDYATVETFPGVTITTSDIAFQGSEYEPVTNPPTPPYSGPNAPPIINFIG